MKRLVMVTAYFNWCHYETKHTNYLAFAQGLKDAGVPLITVECALYGDRFELPAANTIRVRTSSILWQKERLLNIAFGSLPASCDMVAWADCDLLFTEERWPDLTVRLLSHVPVVQLFEQKVRLPRGRLAREKGDEVLLGFMAKVQRNPLDWPAFVKPRIGHPGFAWALRRSVAQKCQLYDGCVTGGADRIIAHAWFGDDASALIKKILPDNRNPYYRQWATRCFKTVQANVSYVPGMVLHLWHGSLLDRQYFARHKILKKYRFDPSLDIALNAYGCWEWSSHKPEMHSWIKTYFENRREDG
jgi:hypothetical protein